MARLRGGEDSEALHDFRVALRRLRSTLRTYRPYLQKSIRKPLRQRLKRLASSTNPARDHEVMLARLASKREGASEPLRKGIDYVVQHLASPAAYDEASLEQDFIKLRDTMTRRLERFDFRLDAEKVADKDPDFRSVTSRAVEEGTRALAEILGRVETIEQAETLHSARIAAKRLRYLIEPWRDQTTSAKRLVRRLKKLQDVLGDLQDTHVLLHQAASCLETAALEQARRARRLALSAADAPGAEPEAGPTEPSRALLALIQNVKRDRVHQFESFQEWQKRTAAKLERELYALGRELAPEITAPLRRWLLRGLPESIDLGAGLRIEEGYLPGSGVTEFVRSVKSGRQVRYERVIELSADTASHSSHTISRQEFLAFWPLTQGRRLSWRLYALSEPANWAIRRWVAPTGETLTFAETREEKPSLEWLRSSEPTEVTKIERYQPIALSRRRTSRRPSPTR